MTGGPPFPRPRHYSRGVGDPACWQHLLDADGRIADVLEAELEAERDTKEDEEPEAEPAPG